MPSKLLYRIRPNHPIDSPPYVLPSPLPQRSRRVKPAPIPNTPVKSSAKRPFPVEVEDGVLDFAPTPKKPKVSNQLKRKCMDEHSPSKKRRLEEEGLVLMDGPNEVLTDGSGSKALLDSNIIIIDD